MKIFVDENIPLMTVRELRDQRFEVIDIRGTDDQGITDEVLWEKAQKEKCLLILDLPCFVSCTCNADLFAV